MIIEIRTVFRTSRGFFADYDEARKHKNREKDDMFPDGYEEVKEVTALYHDGKFYNLTAIALDVK